MPLPRKKSEEKTVEKPRKETPVKERKPPPEYAVKVATRPYVTLNRDYMDVMLRYTRLYVSADFAKVVSVWSQVGICACRELKFGKLVRERSTQAAYKNNTQRGYCKIHICSLWLQSQNAAPLYVQLLNFFGIWCPPPIVVTATRAFQPSVAAIAAGFLIWRQHGVPHLAPGSSNSF